jgi:hypothetical protein
VNQEGEQDGQDQERPGNPPRGPAELGTGVR